MFNYYVYVYLNTLKAGEFNVGKFNFNYEPFYVGKGKDIRCSVHLNVIDKRNKLKQRIIDKIKANNKNPIVVKLYENMSEYSAFRLEKYYIHKIGRRDLKLGSLSNLTDGGEGGSGIKYTRKKRINMLSNKQSIVKYNNNGIILEIFENTIDLSIKYPYLSISHIHRACKSFGRRKIENYFWKYHNGESIGDIVELNDKFKPIFQYDLNSNYIKKWNNINELHKIGYSSGAILKCCRNNMKQQQYYKFKNFMWFFKKEDVTLQIKPYCENNAKGNYQIEHKKIEMYNINNELLGTYNPKELKNMKFFTKTIYGCCNNKFKTSQGFKWKWA